MFGNDEKATQTNSQTYSKHVLMYLLGGGTGAAAECLNQSMPRHSQPSSLQAAVQGRDGVHRKAEHASLLESACWAGLPA